MARKGSLVRFAIMAVIALGVGVGVVFALNIPGFGKAEKVKAVNGQVSIPVSRVSDGKAHFFKFSGGGKDISFFVVKASDGSIRTAFDACDVCYRAKKGYEQQGDAMLCRNCNKKFATNRIGPNSTGGCNPSYLSHREAGGNVVISAEDLQTGARFF